MAGNQVTAPASTGYIAGALFKRDSMNIADKIRSYNGWTYTCRTSISGISGHFCYNQMHP
jgi:hypothetical protein